MNIMTNNTLDEIIKAIMSRRLGKSVNMMDNYLLTRQRTADSEEMSILKSDYQRLVDYWQMGGDDPQRQALYDKLLRRMYALTTNIKLHESLLASSFLQSLNKQARQNRNDWSLGYIRQMLEDYVSNIALLDLEQPHLRKQKMADIYSSHQNEMNALFDYIFLSRSWKANVREAFKDMLLSPTIDTIDLQLMVSAITLSCLRAFCIHKFMTLVEVYEKTTDETLRQRALVGWVLCMDSSKQSLFTELSDTVKRLCENERCRQELKELQMQFVLCTRADDDSRKIKDEILPELMDGNHLKMTTKGMVETEEDQLETILNPDAEEQKMERMEANIRKIANMQKNGTDIYYAGFSQMKRFPFFNHIASWFVPFYPQHPSISTIWNHSKGHQMLQGITQMGAFCDSDKYSFVLAFEQVLNHLPQQMLEMVEKGEATPMPVGGEVSLEQQHQPAFIRRSYLQNLYRFFRLFPQRHEFKNPFEGDDNRIYFCCNKLFEGTAFEKLFVEIASFLTKQGNCREALLILNNLQADVYGFDYHMLKGYLQSREGQNQNAMQSFQAALVLEPDNPRALKNYARQLFLLKDYQKAMMAFEKLMLLLPDNHDVELNTAVCHVCLKHYDEASKLLYKLNYSSPDNLHVNHTLAWVQVLLGKYDVAERMFQKLMNSDAIIADGVLNYGYCLWFQNKVNDALQQFKQYQTLLSEEDTRSNAISHRSSLEHVFLVDDHELLSEHGIGDVEIMLMLDNLI